LRLVKDARWDGANIQGKVDRPVTVPEPLQAYVAIATTGDVELYVDELKSFGCQVYPVKAGCKSYRSGDRVFIFEGHVAAAATSVDPHFIGLKAYCDFVEQAKDRANFATSDEAYFHEGKSATLRIKAIPFDRLHQLKPLDGLLRSINITDDHEVARTTIFRAVLIEILDGQADGPAALANRWNQLESMFEDRYRLYVHGFGISKVMAEAQREHSDFAKRYQSLVADAGGKLLAIPAGFVFLGAQITSSPQVPWRNETIVGGALLFALIILVTLFIQFLDIRMLRSSLKAYRARAASQVTTEKARIIELFKPLLHRTVWLYVLIALFSVATIGLLGVALARFPMGWGQYPVLPSVPDFRYFL